MSEKANKTALKVCVRRVPMLSPRLRAPPPLEGEGAGRVAGFATC